MISSLEVIGGDTWRRNGEGLRTTGSPAQRRPPPPTCREVHPASEARRATLTITLPAAEEAEGMRSSY